jgi:outer membrane immunogenic protein
MKKLFLASVAAIVTFVGGAATAADLPRKGPVAAPIVRPACAQFGGFYIGGNVGWGFYDHTFNDRDHLGATIDDGLPASISGNDGGVNAGIQAGYNWQRGCTVFGVEADWSWANNKFSEFQLDGDQAPGGITDSVNVESRLRWFGTARTRAGLVVDDVLLYVTGGLAFAKFDRTWTFFQDGGPSTAVFSSDKTRLGWTAGVGAEWQFAPHWSLKSEVLYMRFEQSDVTVTGNSAIAIGTTGVSYRLDSTDSMWVTRAGVNYRF